MTDAAPSALAEPVDCSLIETKLLGDLDRSNPIVPWFDAVPFPLVGFDTAGLIAIWNGAAADLFGWTAPEALGTPGAFIPDDLRPVHRTHLDRLYRGETIAGELLLGRTRDGTCLLLRATARLTLDGALYTLVPVEPAVEPTPAVLLDAEERRCATLGRLLPGIAHDVNNLLSVVCGYSDLLSEELDPSDPRRELADLIGDLSRQAADFLHYVNGLSRPTDRVEVDLHDLFAKLARLLPRYVGSDIRFSAECAPNLGSIAVDPIEALQLVLNLVGNARDATPDGGAVAVRVVGKTFADAQPGWPQTVPTGAFAVLTVSDTGRGMDDDTLRRIFEPRFTTRADSGGSGLGLCTVAEIVGRGGGFIQVDSEPGWGTRFRVFFPRG